MFNSPALCVQVNNRFDFVKRGLTSSRPVEHAHNYTENGTAMKVYLDTNLWNELCDQSVDPEQLLAGLAAKNANLVLSYHVVYELAKCFRDLENPGSERGRILFTYLREFIRRNIFCITEIMEVLPAEMSAVRSGTPLKAFLSPEGYSALSANIERLANGDFDEPAKAFVEERAALAPRIRSGPVDQLDRRPDVRQRLKSISAEQLGAWLQAETMTDRGAGLLADHVRRRFSEASPLDAAEWASGLLVSPTCRLSKALVRADLYYNWRCANRGSNPKDLFDDMYHVLNAIYCDVYATKEPGHAQYAGLLLSPSTKVAIYDRQTPVGEWIEALC
jgi:hypothetical protein